MTSTNYCRSIITTLQKYDCMDYVHYYYDNIMYIASVLPYVPCYGNTSVHYNSNMNITTVIDVHVADLCMQTIHIKQQKLIKYSV